MRHFLAALLACTLIVGAIATTEAGTTAPDPAKSAAPHSPRDEPGQLVVASGAAVELDGRPVDGTDPAAFAWRVVEGEGARLYSTDQPKAVFVAPEVASGIEDFVVELRVTYAELPPSTRSVRIRVLPTDPDAAKAGAGGDTEWLDDFYSAAAEAEREKPQAPAVVVPPTSGVTTMGFGFGPYPYWGGIGFRWSMSYPISQPVAVPPPGEHQGPGEGEWAPPTRVSSDRLDSSFPSGIADRYRLLDDPEPETPEPTEDEPD